MITSYLPEVSPASLVAESAMNSKVTFERVRQGGISVMSYFVVDF